ncbi:MAG: hypothetical protein E7559_09290, partial [Ruminococcaceae bacterium]|nr:hypothetical protein [Oscillospiraceae bacterium]
MAEPGKNGGSAAPVKGYSLSVFLFVVGIVAVGLTILFSGFSKMPKTVLVSELLVLGCLVGLLIVSIVAKKRVESQYEQQERYPYTSVDKKSIENIFDIIADEEKKRQRLDAFAAGVDFQATQPARAQTQSSFSEKKDERPAQSSPAPAVSSPADSSDEDNEDKPVIAVLDADEEEDSSDSQKTESDGEGSEEVRDNNDDRPRERAESGDRERPGAERRGGPNAARRPAGAPPQKKRRPPYDP